MNHRIAGAVVVATLFLTASARAQPCGTQVQGIAVGTWTLAGSPYCVVGDLTVSRDAFPGSLTIESGVQVRVAPGAQIRVTGTLRGLGTAVQPIVFTGDDPAGRWGGLWFDRAGEQSTLQHCRIERASNSGLRIDDTVVDLEHCEIRDNRTPGNGGG
ncbi:MAG: hypothetical protein AAF628_04400, partial [Planctomycetota bacterium]